MTCSDIIVSAATLVYHASKNKIKTQPLVGLSLVGIKKFLVQTCCILRHIGNDLTGSGDRLLSCLPSYSFNPAGGRTYLMLSVAGFKLREIRTFLPSHLRSCFSLGVSQKVKLQQLSHGGHCFSLPCCFTKQYYYLHVMIIIFNLMILTFNVQM